MCDPNYPKRRAHPFLDEVRAHFLTPNYQNWGAWETAPSHHYDNIFARTFAQLAEKHSNPENDKISVVHKQLEEAKNVYMEQIELLLERGEHIDILEDKTSNLAKESVVFKQKAHAMKMRFCMKNAKLIAVIVILVLVVVFLLVWFACGVPDFKTCAALANKGGGEITPLPTPPVHAPTVRPPLNKPPTNPPANPPINPPVEAPTGR